MYPADIVILGIGVKPETALAEMAGVEVGRLGGIRVDDQLHTSDPDIFAVGDAVEKVDCMTGEWSLVALAGPANRQGRIAADVICGRDSRFRGTQGTAILGAFGGAVAWTGVNEKTLKRMGDDDFEKIYLYPNSHAGYYPGATLLAMKVIFRKSDGRLLGAQAVGREGVDKRIDALAMAIQLGGTVYDLEECELCYAPQFGMAKSPPNFAGMVGANLLRGDVGLVHWDSLGDGFLLDVRHPEELAVEQLPGRGQHPGGRAARPPGRAAARPRDPRHLPLGPARLLRDAHPHAERVHGADRRRRHAVARDLRDALSDEVRRAAGPETALPPVAPPLTSARVGSDAAWPRWPARAVGHIAPPVFASGWDDRSRSAAVGSCRLCRGIVAGAASSAVGCTFARLAYERWYAASDPDTRQPTRAPRRPRGGDPQRRKPQYCNRWVMATRDTGRPADPAPLREQSAAVQNGARSRYTTVSSRPCAEVTVATGGQRGS